MKTGNTATIRINEKTHRLLKGLAGLNGVTLSEMVARLADFWTAENPDSEECRLCRKFGHEPNEETIKALEEAEKPGKTVPGEEYLKRLDKEFRDA
ncbi:MAG: hypothetical protein GX442_06580 [Candidatus Riflebacteria bacterium]|nr:hypothetical protein [Candidatus Riflebacteria bacterium]